MKLHAREVRCHIRRPELRPYVLDPEEIGRWLGQASEATHQRVLTDSLGWCKAHAPLEEAQRALGDLMLGRALHPALASTYRAGVLHLCQYFGRRLESVALEGMGWEEVATCDRALHELGATWSLESMLDGSCLVELPQSAEVTGTGWFETERCEEIDAFFEELEPGALESWLEEVGGGEREAEMLEEVERWFAFAAERGWALATFWS